MKTVGVSSVQSTGLASGFDRLQTIALDDTPIGQGGFGVVYRAKPIAGQRSAPQVVKLLLDTIPGGAAHGFETIQELQRRLGARHADYVRVGASLIDRHPALLGVPQFSFRGTFEGRPVMGYGANDLSAAGFESLGTVLEDDMKLARLQTLPLHVRMGLALQLVDTFDLLGTQLRYIHADLKAEAIFVDLTRGRCALIDFDSGAAARDADDTPSTFGTKQDWLAPEIVKQLDLSGNRSRVVRVNLYSDLWSVNVGLHYLLFGCHPLFFLSELSERSLRGYLQRCRWPDVDPSFPFFIREYGPAYTAYRHCLDMVAPELIRRLAFTINEGYFRVSQRTTSGQWKVVLRLATRPAIAAFSADRTHVADARPVRLSWRINGAGRVALSGVGDVTGRSFVDVRVRRDTVFTLTLIPAGGPPLTQSISVTVSKVPPVIHTFTTSATHLSRAVPARLEWRVSGADRIEIDAGVGDVSTRGHVDVLPRAATTYTMTATSAFGQTSTATVTVRVSTSPPVVRSFTANPTLLTNKPAVQLQWDVSDDAYAVRIDPIGSVARSGVREVPQHRDTVYELTALSYFGVSARARLRVDVSKLAPVIRHFTVTPTVARPTAPIEIAWHVDGATEIEVTGVGSCTARGSATIRVNDATRVALVARSCFGVSTSRHLHVQVIAPATLNAAQRTLAPRAELAPPKPTIAHASRATLSPPRRRSQ